MHQVSTADLNECSRCEGAVKPIVLMLGLFGARVAALGRPRLLALVGGLDPFTLAFALAGFGPCLDALAPTLGGTRKAFMAPPATHAALDGGAACR